jgi:hypothetical protein
MKQIIIYSIIVLFSDAAFAQNWQPGVRTGIDKTYYPGVLPTSAPTWNTEVYLRREINKWAFEISGGHNKTTQHSTQHFQTFIGPDTYHVINVVKNNITITATCQRQLFTKPKKFKTYLGVSAGLLYRNDKISRTVFFFGNEGYPENEEFKEKYLNPAIGVNYYNSYALTKTIGINLMLNPSLILDIRNTLYSNTRLSAMLGFSCKL